MDEQEQNEISSREWNKRWGSCDGWCSRRSIRPRFQKVRPLAAGRGTVAIEPDLVGWIALC